jgi:hypothetical protein
LSFHFCWIEAYGVPVHINVEMQYLCLDLYSLLREKLARSRKLKIAVGDWQLSVVEMGAMASQAHKVKLVREELLVLMEGG